MVAARLLGRLMHHAFVFEIAVNGYRLREHAKPFRAACGSGSFLIAGINGVTMSAPTVAWNWRIGFPIYARSG